MRDLIQRFEIRSHEISILFFIVCYKFVMFIEIYNWLNVLFIRAWFRHSFSFLQSYIFLIILTFLSIVKFW